MIIFLIFLLSICVSVDTDNENPCEYETRELCSLNSDCLWYHTGKNCYHLAQEKYCKDYEVIGRTYCREALCVWDNNKCQPKVKFCADLVDNTKCNKYELKCTWEPKFIKEEHKYKYLCRTLYGSCKEMSFVESKEECNAQKDCIMDDGPPCKHILEYCENQDNEVKCNEAEGKCVWEAEWNKEDHKYKCRLYFGSCKEQKGENECNKIQGDLQKCVWDWEAEWNEGQQKYNSECRSYSGACKDQMSEDKCNEIGEKCVWETEWNKKDRKYKAKCQPFEGSCKEQKNEDGCKELEKCVWEAEWNKTQNKYEGVCRVSLGSCKELNHPNKCEINSNGMPCIWNAFKKEPDCVPLHDFCHQHGSDLSSVCESIWDCEWKDNKCTTAGPSKWID